MDMASSGGPTCLAVYIALARAESDSTEHKQGFFIDEVELGKLCRCCDRTINTHTEYLHSIGVIRKVSGKGKKYKGRPAANRYTLIEIDGEANYNPSRGREHNVPSSLSEHNVQTKKESLSSSKKKERRLSKEKGADAGTPPASAGGSDSAPEKNDPQKVIGTF